MKRITITITDKMDEGIEALYRQHAPPGAKDSDAWKVLFVLCFHLHMLDELGGIRHGGQRAGSGRKSEVDKLAPEIDES